MALTPQNPPVDLSERARQMATIAPKYPAPSRDQEDAVVNGPREVRLSSEEYREFTAECGWSRATFDGRKLTFARKIVPGRPSGAFAVAQPINGAEELRDIIACLSSLADAYEDAS